MFICHWTCNRDFTVKQKQNMTWPDLTSFSQPLQRRLIADIKVRGKIIRNPAFSWDQAKVTKKVFALFSPLPVLRMSLTAWTGCHLTDWEGRKRPPSGLTELGGSLSSINQHVHIVFMCTKSGGFILHQCFSSHSQRGVELAYCKWQHKGAEMANAFRYINRLFLVVKG